MFIVQIINFGLTTQNKANLPIFSPRREAGNNLGIIIWPFDRQNIQSMSSWITEIDTDFASKHAMAILTDGLETSTKYIDTTPMRDRIQNMLQYRYLIVPEDANCYHTDLTVRSDT
jgi:hypothetical protein